MNLVGIHLFVFSYLVPLAFKTSPSCSPCFSLIQSCQEEEEWTLIRIKLKSKSYFGTAHLLLNSNDRSSGNWNISWHIELCQRHQSKISFRHEFCTCKYAAFVRCNPGTEERGCGTDGSHNLQKYQCFVCCRTCICREFYEQSMKADDQWREIRQKSHFFRRIETARMLHCSAAAMA